MPAVPTELGVQFIMLVLIVRATIMRLQRIADEEAEWDNPAVEPVLSRAGASLNVWDEFSNVIEAVFQPLLRLDFQRDLVDFDEAEVLRLVLLCQAAFQGLHQRRVGFWYVLPRQKAWFSDFAVAN